MDRAQHNLTILLPAALHERLSRLAQQRRVSISHLTQQAVEAHYGPADPNDRLAAVRKRGALSLPVDSAAAMKAESEPQGVSRGDAN